MKVLLLVAACLTLIAVVSGVLTYRIGTNEQSGQNNPSTVSAVKQVESNKWQAVLKKVDAYYQAPAKKSPQQIEAERQAQLAKEKKPSLTDARLVGIVIDQPSKVFVLTPNDAQPQELSLGEGWLAPWVLHEVFKDKVVWQDETNNQTTVQYIFSES